MNRSWSLPLSLLAGCYGAVPPHPAPVALPMLSSEAPISVHTQSRVVIESRRKQERTCPANVTDEHDPKCLVTTREVVEPVTRVETTASYGPEVINYAQFRVLTDPHYDEKLTRLDELRVRCARANVPRWTGGALVLGGLITALVGSNKGVSDTVSYVGWSAVAAGFASYAIGYYGFGGHDCNEASRLFRELDLREAARWTKVAGTRQADEMAALAKRFNDLHRLRDEAPSADPPPAAAERTSGASTATTAPNDTPDK